MKNKIKLLTRRIFALVAVICLLSALCIPCFATDYVIVEYATINTLEDEIVIGENDIEIYSRDDVTMVLFDVAKYNSYGEFNVEFFPLTFNIEDMIVDRGIPIINFYIGDIMQGNAYDYVLTGRWHYDDLDTSEDLFLSGSDSSFQLTGFDLTDWDSLEGYSTVTFEDLTLHFISTNYALHDVQLALSDYYIPAEPVETEVAVFGVFDVVGSWIAGSVISLFAMFYTAESGLTFLGVLGVAGLAFSVIFLIIGVICRFLHFRG